MIYIYRYDSVRSVCDCWVEKFIGFLVGSGKSIIIVVWIISIELF